MTRKTRAKLLALCILAYVLTTGCFLTQSALANRCDEANDGTFPFVVTSVKVMGKLMDCPAGHMGVWTAAK